MTVRVEKIGSRAEVAELAKIASVVGMTLTLYPADESNTQACIFERHEPHHLVHDLARMAYLEAYTSGRSVRDVLTVAADLLERWNAGDLDTPPSDQPGIADRPSTP